MGILCAEGGGTSYGTAVGLPRLAFIVESRQSWRQ